MRPRAEATRGSKMRLSMQEPGLGVQTRTSEPFQIRTLDPQHIRSPCVISLQLEGSAYTLATSEGHGQWVTRL